MEQWLKQWFWPVVILLVVAWAGAFAISFFVAESRTSDGEESIVRIDRAADWVACQAGKTKSTPLTTGEQTRIKNECGIRSSAWVLCADDEISKLGDQRLSAFTSSDAVRITELCRERLEAPTEP